MIVSALRPRIVSRAATRRPRRGRRCASTGADPGATVGPLTSTSPVRRGPDARAEQRPAEGRDLRAGLGHAVGRRDRDAGGRRALEQRRPRSALRRAAPSAAPAARASPASSSRCERRRDERDERRPARGRAAPRARARCRSARGRPRSCRRSPSACRIESPPTCESGRQQSQRSCRVDAERSRGARARSRASCRRSARRASGVRARPGGVDDDRRRARGRGSPPSAGVAPSRSVVERPSSITSAAPAAEPRRLGRAEPRVDRDRDRAVQQAGVKRRDEGLARRQRDRDAVAGGAPRGGAGRSRPARASCQQRARTSASPTARVRRARRAAARRRRAAANARRRPASSAKV